MSVKLSICIPTFNRGAFIGDTLASIATQLVEGVEVVIVDGASTDNTAEVLSSWRNRYPMIRYHCGARNEGVDADLATCVEMASGEYCWLMSSDDLLAEGAVARILSEIARCKADIFLTNRIDCTSEMTPIRVQPWIERESGDHVFEFLKRADLTSYFDYINTIGALFSYIPCVIVSRLQWISISDGDKFHGTNYAHVYRLFKILGQGSSLKYIHEALVLCRMDNDSFSSDGMVNRYLLDFKGYSKIAEGLFSQDKTTRSAFLRVITREHNWRRLLKIRGYCKGSEEWSKVQEVLRGYGYPQRTIQMCGLLGAVKPLVFVAARLYSILRHINRLKPTRFGA